MTTHRTRIASGIEVEFVFDAEGRSVNVNWLPERPRQLDGQALRRYRAARDLFLQRVAAHVGGTVACVETGTLETSLIRPPKAGHA